MNCRSFFARFQTVFAGVVLLVFGIPGAVNAAPQFETVATFRSDANRATFAGLCQGEDGFWYGVTRSGGPEKCGTIYKIDPETGVQFTISRFSGSGTASNRGANPDATLTSDGAGHLWGTTTNAGLHGFGTVFKLKTSDGTLTTVVDITNNGLNNKGLNALGRLYHDGHGYLWGTTYAGGASYFGTVFKINLATEVLTTVVEFTGPGAGKSGANPRGGVIADDAGFLWGATSSAVYKINPTTGQLTVVAAVANTYGELATDGNGFVWGVTASSDGTIYKVNMATGEKTTMATFGSSNLGTAYSLYSGLVNDRQGCFWGVSSDAGPYLQGTVFKIEIATGQTSRVVSFADDAAARGLYPTAALTLDDQGFLWGLSTHDAAHDKGAAFKVKVSDGTFEA